MCTERAKVLSLDNAINLIISHLFTIFAPSHITRGTMDKPNHLPNDAVQQLALIACLSATLAVQTFARYYTQESRNFSKLSGAEYVKEL